MIGRTPSHPKGRYRVSLQLMKFLNEQYCVTSMDFFFIMLMDVTLGSADKIIKRN